MRKLPLLGLAAEGALILGGNGQLGGGKKGGQQEKYDLQCDLRP